MTEKRKEYLRNYRLANRERLNAYQRAYYQSHKEQIRRQRGLNMALKYLALEEEQHKI